MVSRTTALNTSSVKNRLSNCSLKMLPQSELSECFLKVFAQSCLPKWLCVCAHGGAMGHGCRNAGKSKPKAKHCWNVSKCRQLPKIYMSTPKYLLCIKSSEHITADAPGISLNSLQGLLPGNRCQLCGVQHVETQGAEGSKFFQELSPSASAWQRTALLPGLPFG